MAVKKGDAAREAVRDKIINAFGSNYITTLDKKIYVKAKDGPNGEVLQFAITMTMPKVPVSADGAAPAVGNALTASASVVSPTELSAEDDAKVKELMAKLGVS